MFNLYHPTGISGNIDTDIYLNTGSFKTSSVHLYTKVYTYIVIHKVSVYKFV